MNILTCFTVAPDMDMLAEQDWTVTDLQVDMSFVKRELNCFDESALEMSLIISDALQASGKACSLAALHIGGGDADPVMKTLHALRFDRTARIDCTEDLRFAPMRTARIIAEYVREHPCDLILMGSRSSLGNNAQTPLLLAEIMKIPCVTQVTSIDPEHGRQVRVVSRLGEGELEQVIELPLVAGIGNARNTLLRVPTLKDKITFGSRPVRVIPLQEIISDVLPDDFRERCTLESLERVNDRRDGIIIEEGSSEEKAELLYERYLKERLEAL